MLENFEFDHLLIQKYIKDHKTSSVIPRSLSYRGRRWGQLTHEETKHLYEIAKAYLEDLVGDWDKWNSRVINTETPGRGLRARPTPIESIRSRYSVTIDRTRQVNFVPYLSTWFAFVRPEVKEAIYRRIVDTFTMMTGVELLYPPKDKGSYWLKIAELLDEGFTMVNGDGSNWERSTCTIAEQYHCSVDDGIYQLPSGIAMTTNLNSIASAMFFDAYVKDKSGIRAVGILGDDCVIIGKPDKVNSIESVDGVWEIDDIGTRIKCILGVCILKDHKGTYPGVKRGTVDRADLAIAVKVGQQTDWIEGTMGPVEHEVYDEVMAYGTLKGRPFLDAIGEYVSDEFWDDWARDKTGYAANISSGDANKQTEATTFAEEEALVSL
jgi:hypothetical protein